MAGDGVVYNSQLDAFALYHIIQEEAGRASAGSGVGPALPALGHALAGSVATASAKVLLYPLDLVITRLQVQRQLRGKGEAESAAKDADKEYSSLIDAARKIYRTEGGLKAFYTGCAPDVGKGIIDSFLFFLAYTFLRQYEQRRAAGKGISIGKELGVGIAAGSFAKFVTTPIQNIVTRQQTAALVAARDPNSSVSGDLSIKDIFLQIRDERGLAGFWAGYSESVVLTLNPAITFAIDNVLKRLLPHAQRDSPSPQVTFLLAAVSKALATTITYPVMLAKSRAQVAGREDEQLGESTEYIEKPDTNSTSEKLRAKRALKKVLNLFAAQAAMLHALRRIYNEEGLAGLYSGLEGEVLKGFLQHGITMMMKEKAHVGVIELYYLMLKVTRRWDGELKKAQDSANAVASEAQERAANVGETVAEGARNIAEKATTKWNE